MQALVLIKRIVNRKREVVELTVSNNKQPAGKGKS